MTENVKGYHALFTEDQTMTSANTLSMYREILTIILEVNACNQKTIKVKKSALSSPAG